jgi:aryl-alcohol dehydrogenase-like predicted oxidoreductase
MPIVTNRSSSNRSSGIVIHCQCALSNFHSNPLPKIEAKRDRALYDDRLKEAEFFMKYIRLGNTGLKVSRICLGTMTYGSPQWREWVLSEEQSRPFIRRSLEAGINFFDTADMYSLGESEAVLGRALKELAKREQVVIATKVFNPMSDAPNDRGLSRKHIFNSIDASLQRLQTDYVDLYQIHRWDHETPIEETLEALHDLVKAGKVRYIGASSMYAWQFAKALYLADLHGWTRFVSMQNHYNLVYREEEREMLPLCRAEGIGVIPWSPLARGFLAGNRQKETKGETTRAKTDDFAHKLYYQDADFQIVDRVVELAQKRGVAPAQIALAWLLHQPGVTAPIIGASKMNHLEDALAALEIELSPEECQSLEEFYQPHPVLGHQ